MALILTILFYISATVATLIAGYFAFVYYLSAKSRKKFEAQNLKYVPMPSLLSQMSSKDHLILRMHKIVMENGPLFGSSLLGQNTIVVSSPEIAQQVLSKDFTNFTNRRKFNFGDPIFQAFLSVAEDEQWKRIRSIVTPTFSTGALRRMKPRLDDTIATLIDNIDKTVKKNPIVNVKEIFGAFTMDTIMQVAFGFKVDSIHDPNNHIVQMAKKTFASDIKVKQIIQFALLFFMPRLMKLLGIKNEVMDFFKDFSRKVIKEKREELKQDSTNIGKANNFLELLLEAEAENDKVKTENEDSKAVKFMTNDEMIAQCILFFVAAYDTTTSAISLSTYFLALNPEIQERLYEEIDSKLRELAAGTEEPDNLDPMKLVTFESLQHFDYLSAVINETLRLFPPTFIERTAAKDTRLESEDGSIVIDVKKGDIVNFPAFSMHRDPSQFPDPERFDPERFLAKEPTFHKYSYLPFGSGPRNCVARSLALLEAKMALLNAVYKYRFSPCEETKIPVQFYSNSGILTPREITLKVL